MHKIFINRGIFQQNVSWICWFTGAGQQPNV